MQVSGRLSDKDEEFKLIADEIKELPNDDLYGMAVKEMEKKSQVILHMDTLASMPALNKIKEVLERHAGSAQVYLSLGSGSKAKKIKTQSLVTISSELIAELRAVPEVAMVDVN